MREGRKKIEPISGKVNEGDKKNIGQISVMINEG